MKCPMCDGKGIMTVHNVGTDENFRTECDKCHGTGEVELTNEEWLRSATTEQLAEFIAHQTLIALLENQNNHSLRMTYPAYWMEWLKEIHE